MKKLCVTVFLTFIALGLIANKAFARAQYLKQFTATYVGEESSEAQKALAEAMGKVKKCNTCHSLNSKTKKDRNAYGQALSKLLKKNEKDVEKIKQALATVSKEKETDTAKHTYGQLLKEGKLPVTEKKK